MLRYRNGKRSQRTVGSHCQVAFLSFFHAYNRKRNTRHIYAVKLEAVPRAEPSEIRIYPHQPPSYVSITLVFLRRTQRWRQEFLSRGPKIQGDAHHPDKVTENLHDYHQFHRSMLGVRTPGPPARRRLCSHLLSLAPFLTKFLKLSWG